MRQDQNFTALDHWNVTRAAEKYGEDFEAIAKEVGRPQWAIAAFHYWMMYISGVWFTYWVVQAGRKRRWSEVGTNAQILIDGTW